MFVVFSFMSISIPFFIPWFSCHSTLLLLFILFAKLISDMIMQTAMHHWFNNDQILSISSDPLLLKCRYGERQRTRTVGMILIIPWKCTQGPRLPNGTSFTGRSIQYTVYCIPMRSINLVSATCNYMQPRFYSEIIRFVSDCMSLWTV